MVAGCAPLLLAIKETMGIGGTRRIGATAGNRTLVTRLGRPAANHTHGSNEKSPGTFPCWGLNMAPGPFHPDRLSQLSCSC